MALKLAWSANSLHMNNSHGQKNVIDLNPFLLLFFNNILLGSKDLCLMFRIIFWMCWQTENKTCLVYVLGNA